MAKFKRILTGILIVVGCFAFMLGALVFSFIYVTRYRLTDIGKELSPDGRYSLVFQEKGEPDFPFGYSHARVTLYDGDKKVKQLEQDIADDGARFRKSNYTVEWFPAGAVVTFSGSEQGDMVVEIAFDGGDIVEGYSKGEEAISTEQNESGEISQTPSKEDALTVTGNEGLSLDEEMYVSSQEPSDIIEAPDSETVRLWAETPSDCSYTFPDGTQYKMTPVDRALGSSFYVLLSVEGDDLDTVKLINLNPYNGHGGSALWLEFIDGSDLGFSCLTYNGGDSSMFFRTQDGGKSFQEIEYPSAEVRLSDGSFYNPFVIPEKVWREDGKLYMLAGQDANGDYSGSELKGRVSGLYSSDNEGKTFVYVKETLE